MLVTILFFFFSAKRNWGSEFQTTTRNWCI